MMPLEMFPATGLGSSSLSQVFSECSCALQRLSPEAMATVDSALSQHNRLDGLQRMSQADSITHSIW